MNPILRLQSLYMQQSKHSGYQILADRLRELLPQERIVVRSRQERERLQFIATTLELAGKRVLDIGANAGFFTFEALAAGAREVVAYEGNPALAEFVRVAAEVLAVGDKVDVRNAYLDPLHVDALGRFDVTFLMNVLHHMGDDFGIEPADIGGVRASIAESIRRMAGVTRHLVLQLGYCWKGNRELPLLDHGTKQDQMELVSAASAGCWKVVATGIPEPTPEGIAYRPVSSENCIRRDAMGEFLNRPLFVLESQVLE